jgi:hypothetical protein
LANVILVGKLQAALGFSTEETLKKAIDKSISAKHIDLAEANKRALALGEIS